MNRIRVKQLLVGSLVSLIVVVSMWAQGNQSNPFAPLAPTGGGDVPPPMMPLQDRDDEDLATFQEPVLTGLLWQAERPVAIINDLALTLGSYHGSAKVTQIQPQFVELTHPSGFKQVLYLRGGLSTAGGSDSETPVAGQLDLNIEDVPGRAVLEALAYQAELNLVFVGENEQRISLHLREVTWEEALNAVIRAANCVVSKQDRNLVVQDSKVTQVTRTFALNHGKSKTMEPAVSKLLTENGKVGVDERLNAIVVTDTAENLTWIEEAILKMDQKSPQVLIEVLIVNVKLTHERKMGVDWQMIFTKAAGEGAALTNSMNSTGPVGVFNNTSQTPSFTNPSTVGDFRFITGDWEFTGLIDFIENQDDITVLANPKVFVLNNRTAVIEAVEEIPYQKLEQTGNGPPIGTIEFKPAGVKLEVTPQITSDDYIVMHVIPEQSVLVDTFVIENSETPVVDKRKTETYLRVKDGQTIIIGGLRKKEPFVKESRVPILADIPLLGKLFKKVHEKEIDTELSVFLTPRIYREGAPAGNDLALVDADDDIEALWNKMVIKK